MKGLLNPKLIILFNDISVFGLVITTSIFISRYFGLEFLGLSTYYFVFLTPIITISRFSIDKKILALLDENVKINLDSIAYYSSIIILVLG